MKIAPKVRHNSCSFFHFERPRLNSLFMHAIKYPLILVCAGVGYGKTSAVVDFTNSYKVDTAWVRLSEHDNSVVRFWKNYTNALSQINEPFARAMGKLGFPHTPDRLNQYTALLRHHIGVKQRLIVMDDFHFIDAPDIIRFIEHDVLNMPMGSSLFLLSRSTPHINTTDMAFRSRIFSVREEDLCFTKNEVAQYFRRLEISLQPGNEYPRDTLHEIMQDTEGWAFAINLIARSYQNFPPKLRLDTSVQHNSCAVTPRKALGYTGYLRTAMKTNIYRLMEMEIWDRISERLRYFLIRLALINHLSVDLISLLAGEDNDLITELERQNAHVRRDRDINAYLVQPLFLGFLASKKELLPEDLKRETYAIAGKWCDRNGFKVDAISYYEKTGDYESIVNIFVSLPVQIPQDIARHAALVFERAPMQAFDTVPFLASTHLRSVMSQGLFKKVIELAEYYEVKYLKLPENDPFRQSSLASIYYCWGVVRVFMNLTEDTCDFERYFRKLGECFPQPVEHGNLIKLCHGPWICSVGSARKESMERYTGALTRTNAHIARCFTGFATGEDDLAFGELKFYQGDIHTAKIYITRALDRAREKKHPDVTHRALLYTMRIAVFNGDFQKAEQAHREMKVQPDDTDYYNRFVNADISLAWYYFILNMPEKVPECLQENFSPYAFAGFIENFANQVKARYCYMTRNYPPLLSYIQEAKQRESYLFGRIEMLTMEACVHYKMKNREKACAVLAEAYEAAAPNAILMPFIELGKDMRTLTAFSLNECRYGISESWLETVNRKSSSYAKRLAHLITKYKQASGLADGIAFSPREREIFADLSRGLSRVEISASRGLSINTVKMMIKNVYMKLGAETLADAVRIATEQKII